MICNCKSSTLISLRGLLSAPFPVPLAIPLAVLPPVSLPGPLRVSTSRTTSGFTSESTADFQALSWGNAAMLQPRLLPEHREGFTTTSFTVGGLCTTPQFFTLFPEITSQTLLKVSASPERHKPSHSTHLL